MRPGGVQITLREQSKWTRRTAYRSSISAAPSRLPADDDSTRTGSGRGHPSPLGHSACLVWWVLAYRDHTLLDYTIQNFEVVRAPVQTASNVLRMSLISQLHPEVKGFAETFRPGESAHKVGPFSETDKTVRDLLIQLVTGSQGGVWMAKRSAVEEGSLPGEPYWEILQYTTPEDDNLSRLKTIPGEWIRWRIR